MRNATEGRLMFLYPEVKRKASLLLTRMSAHGTPMKVVESIRSFARQEKLYASGRTNPGSLLTASAEFLSRHHYGLALDCCFLGKVPYPPTEDWAKYMEVAKDLGFKVGSKFSGGAENRQIVDITHIEIDYGLPGAALRKLYKEGKLNRVWAYLDKLRGSTENWTAAALRSQEMIENPDKTDII